MEGSHRRRTKASFFACGEELQGFLEVLDGRADVLVLQGAAGVLAVLLGLGVVLRGEMNTAWRMEGGVSGGEEGRKRVRFEDNKRRRRSLGRRSGKKEERRDQPDISHHATTTNQSEEG